MQIMAEHGLGILILSAIAALLALLIEGAHRFIADYGECRILINGERELVVQGGVPLLFALQDRGIFIPSACGGKGTCSYCKIKVTAGAGPVLPTEIPYLDDAETAAGVRLSCQVKVRNDLEITIPEELFLIREFRVRTEEILPLTPFIKAFRFSIVDSGETLAFKPGQYIQLEVPAGKKSQAPEFRAYSLANTPHTPGEFEIFVARSEKGIVSVYLHDRLQVGDELLLRGPFGDFFYRPGDRAILMIATGSGLAPLLSILRHMKESGLQRRVTLFFGNRTPEDLFCTEELESYVEVFPGFTYIPILSRVTEAHDWPGARGRVTDLIQEKILPDADLDVYICGSSAMVEDSLEILENKGIPESQIHFDKFD